MPQQSAIQYLAGLSNHDESDIEKFFDSFGVNSSFSAHQNVINSLNDLLICPVNSDIFHSLIEYQKLSSWVTNLSKSNLRLAGPAGQKFNPVQRVSELPMTALLLVIKDSSDEINNAVNILTILIVLASLSSKNSSENTRLINHAATQIRIAYETSSESDSLLKFWHWVESAKGLFTLKEILSTLSEDKNNAEPFKSSLKLIPIIDHEATKVLPASKLSVFIDGNESLKIHSYSAQVNKLQQNTIDTSEVLLITEENSFYDITKDQVSKKVLKRVSEHAYKELNDFSDSQQEILHHSQKSHQRIIIDKTYLKMKTSLFNVIEREWLVAALLNPEKYHCSEGAALLLGLSICLKQNCIDILKLSISDSGNVRPNGFFTRKIPQANKAKKVTKKNKHLYQPHVNDSEEAYILLPFPNFITKKLTLLTKNKSLKVIGDIFKESDIEMSQQTQDLVKALNKTYGSRFNYNRISSQLDHFIKSEKNDPCISFALFGSSRQRAPTAYYYRSIEAQRIIEIYITLAERYFSYE